jgi:hypothetical protein
MGRKEVSGANFSHAAGRAGAFFTGEGREPLLYFLYSQPSLVPITRATIRMVEAMANFSATSMRAGIPG